MFNVTLLRCWWWWNTAVARIVLCVKTRGKSVFKWNNRKRRGKRKPCGWWRPWSKAEPRKNYENCKYTLCFYGKLNPPIKTVLYEWKFSNSLVKPNLYCGEKPFPLFSISPPPSPPPLAFCFSPTPLPARIVKSALYNNLTSLIHSHPSRENPIASSSISPIALCTVDSSKHRYSSNLLKPPSPPFLYLPSPSNPPTNTQSVNNRLMSDKMGWREIGGPLKCYKGLMCDVRYSPP